MPYKIIHEITLRTCNLEHVWYTYDLYTYYYAMYQFCVMKFTEMICGKIEYILNRNVLSRYAKSFRFLETFKNSNIAIEDEHFFFILSSNMCNYHLFISTWLPVKTSNLDMEIDLSRPMLLNIVSSLFRYNITPRKCE